MTKKTPKPATAGSNPNALQIARTDTETSATALAHAALRPTVQAAVTLHEFNRSFGELSMNTLVDDLVHQCTLANKGDLSRAEALLTAQAHTLDSIFNSLARRAALNMGEYVHAAETYLRLALKAQSQCRATIETLALMKNPQPVTFVRQANVAHGPQQVNNVPQPSQAEASHARESENSQNKLLEQQHGERLEHGATTTTVGADSAVAALAEIHRPDNCRR
jgi:hypothetical protein